MRGASNQHSAASNPEAAGVTDIGLTHKDIHEARELRDAENEEPGTRGERRDLGGLHIRFAPNSGARADIPRPLLWAINGH